MCLHFRGCISTTRSPFSGSASYMRLPFYGGVSTMRSHPGGDTSYMCPVAVGPNASSCVVSAFSAPLAGSMLEVPLTRAGAVPDCARQGPGFDFPRVLIGVHSQAPSFVRVNARRVDPPCVLSDLYACAWELDMTEW